MRFSVACSPGRFFASRGYCVRVTALMAFAIVSCYVIERGHAEPPQITHGVTTLAGVNTIASQMHSCLTCLVVESTEFRRRLRMALRLTPGSWRVDVAATCMPAALGEPYREWLAKAAIAFTLCRPATSAQDQQPARWQLVTCEGSLLRWLHTDRRDGSLWQLRSNEHLGDAIVCIENASNRASWQTSQEFTSSPDDVDAEMIDALGCSNQGFHVGFADGAVRRLAPTVPADLLRHYLTVEGARAHSADFELTEYALSKRAGRFSASD